jgi:hypothetical protein
MLGIALRVTILEDFPPINKNFFTYLSTYVRVKYKLEEFLI